MSGKQSSEQEVRKATANDLNGLWMLWKEIQDQKVYFAYDSSYSKEDILAIWINLKNHVYVVEMNGEIIGGYIMKPNHPGHGSHIVNAAYLVSSTQRGKGLGHILCEHSIQAAKDLGYRAMQFNLVVSTNAGAISIWDTFGFKVIGTIPGGFHHVEKGYVDALIYYKDLISAD